MGHYVVSRPMFVDFGDNVPWEFDVREASSFEKALVDPERNFVLAEGPYSEEESILEKQERIKKEKLKWGDSYVE